MSIRIRAATIDDATTLAALMDGFARFLQGNYGDTLAPLYERMVVGRDERACHLSEEGFRTIAAAAGRSPREILRRWRESCQQFDQHRQSR